jgi:acyl-CoA reductase-like NAD-dependent aldehyde dehydrogenase
MSLANLAEHDRKHWHDVATHRWRAHRDAPVHRRPLRRRDRRRRFRNRESRDRARRSPRCRPGDGKDIDRAVEAAKRAFKSGVWSRMAPRKRMEVLYPLRDLIDQHSEIARGARDARHGQADCRRRRR